VAKWSFEEINEASKIITNEYDWTLGYTISSGEELDKKVYTAQMHKVITLHLIIEIRAG
jgi:hypothetical protein